MRAYGMWRLPMTSLSSVKHAQAVDLHLKSTICGNRICRKSCRSTGGPCKADGSGDAANADGEEAVATAQQKPYDLVLMNVHMPKMDGVSATMTIR